MKINLLVILLSAFFVASASAKETFLLKNASKNYDVKIEIEKCDGDTCEGKAIVYVLRKNAANPFQTIRMENCFLELNKQRKPTANLIELYGENNSGVIFDDFNFDGAEDLALRNGNNGSYGGPSYDVYIFSKASKRFMLSKQFSALAGEGYLGMFEMDKKKKVLRTFSKSGCCWHQTKEFRIINNRPREVFRFTEDATGESGEKVKLTTERFVNGRWRKSVKYARTKDYYPNQ